jgi:hypothetical protein
MVGSFLSNENERISKEQLWPNKGTILAFGQKQENHETPYSG